MSKMTPKTRVIGGVISTFFLVLYAYFFGLFDLPFSEFISHQKFLHLAIVAVIGVLSHTLVEFAGRSIGFDKASISLTHKALFLVLIIIGTALIVN